MKYRITSKQIDNLKDLFSKYDLNGNGTVTLEEFSKVFREMNQNLTEDEIEKMFKEADINNDGLIVLEDLIREYEKKAQELIDDGKIDPNLLT